MTSNKIVLIKRFLITQRKTFCRFFLLRSRTGAKTKELLPINATSLKLMSGNMRAMKDQLERVTHIEDLSTLKRGNSGGRREREKDELVKKFIQDFFSKA